MECSKAWPSAIEPKAAHLVTPLPLSFHRLECLNQKVDKLAIARGNCHCLLDLKLAHRARFAVDNDVVQQVTMHMLVQSHLYNWHLKPRWVRMP